MKFTEGDMIRNKKTGQPYLICKITHVCLLVTDSQDNSDPAELFAILPRDYKNYLRDFEMHCTTVHPWEYWEDEYNIFNQL